MSDLEKAVAELVAGSGLCAVVGALMDHVGALEAIARRDGDHVRANKLADVANLLDQAEQEAAE